MKRNNLKIGTTAFLLFLVTAMVFLPIANAASVKNSYDHLADYKTYTDSELQSLYVKYNISENDIKFAKGKLPNVLDETILNGNKKVLVTEDGKPLDNKNTDYDIIISESEMLKIIEQAEKEFYEKYGVDCSNPKVDIVDGKAIPKEEIKQNEENKKFDMFYLSPKIEKYLTPKASWNPKEVNGEIYFHIYPATDSQHKPTESYQQDTIDAIRRFQTFGIQTNIVWHYGLWDASNIGYDAGDALNDLENDCSYIRDDDNDLVIGWVDYLERFSGVAYKNGPFSVCATKSSGLDYPHDSIVQHEISHNFGADDQNSITHPTCIMNRVHAYLGTNVWCDSCKSTVNYGIYN